MKEAVDNILFSESDFLKIKNGIYSLYELFSTHTNIYAGDLTHSHYINTASGLAVSIEHAAHCLKDLMRTTRFLRGIYQSIKDQQNLSKPVRILYAGCGPYATLLTPLTTQFSAEEVQFTLLDINPESIDCAKKLYSELALEDYLENSMVGDATSALTLNSPYDIIISETMAQALKVECQVPLTRNMVQYLKPTGIFIPQKITVEAYVYGKSGLENAEGNQKKPIGTIYELNYKYVPEKGHTCSYPIPESTDRNIYLFTQIQVYKSEIIQHYESGLTTPLIINDSLAEGGNVSFTYVEDDECGYDIQYHD